MTKSRHFQPVAKPFIYTTLYTSIFAISQHAFAYDDTELQQEIKQQIDYQQQQERISQLEQYRQPVKAVQPPVSSEAPDQHSLSDDNDTLQHTVADPNCSDWHSVKLKGLTLLKPKTKEVLDAVAKQLGEHSRCISRNEIRLLSRQVTAAFLEQGYFKTKVTPSTVTTFEDERSELEERQGHTQKLILDFSPAQLAHIDNKTDFSTQHLFGDSVGQPVNMKVIDQGLDQANRLKHHNVSVDVYPKASGDVALVVSDAYEKEAWHGGKVHGEVSVDNLGDESINRARAQFQLGIINPLGKADHLLLYGLSTLPAKDSVDQSINIYSNSVGMNYDIPFGYWTLSLFGGLSQSKRQVQLNINRIAQEGKSWRAGGRVQKVVSRGSHHIQTVNASYSHTDRKNKIGGVLIAAQSPKLQTLELGVNHTELIKRGYLSLNVDYKHDHVESKAFNTIALSVDTQRYFLHQPPKKKVTAPKKNNVMMRGWQVHSRFVGQYAFKALPPGERSTVNNAFGVRGGFDYGINGDSYLSMQNTLSLNTIWGSKHDRFSPYLGLDFARSFQKKSPLSLQRLPRNINAIVLGAKTRIQDAEIDIFASKATIDTHLNSQFSRRSRDRESRDIAHAEDIQVSAVLRWHF